MKDRLSSDLEAVKANVRDCLSSNAAQVRVSGRDQTVVGATFLDPETEELHRVLVGPRGYSIVDDACDDDEAAYEARSADIAFEDFVAKVPSPEWWRGYLIAVNELYRAVENLVGKRPKDAPEQARQKVNEIAVSTEEEYWSLRPDMYHAISAFRTACAKRVPYCSAISLRLPREPGSASRVVFGVKIGENDEVLYQLTHEGGKQTYLYLNGLRTFPDTYRLDIENAYKDEWSRLGACQAAEDLLAIHCAAHSLVEAEMNDLCWAPYNLERAQDRVADLIRRGPAGHSPPVNDDFEDVDRERGIAREAFLDKVKQRLEEPVRTMLAGDANALDGLIEWLEL